MFKNKQTTQWFNHRDFEIFKKSGWDYSLEAWQNYFMDMGFTHIRLDIQKEVIDHITQI